MHSAGSWDRLPQRRSWARLRHPQQLFSICRLSADLQVIREVAMPSASELAIACCYASLSELAHGGTSNSSISLNALMTTML